MVAGDSAMGMAVAIGMDLGGFFVFFQASCFAWLVEFVFRCLSFDGGWVLFVVVVGVANGLGFGFCLILGLNRQLWWWVVLGCSTVGSSRGWFGFWV